ncbi:MAG: ParA family protein [Gammaproteobacteria bacterium]|nr:ParA family protein [Gammaproteobacteria bacterium]
MTRIIAITNQKGGVGKTTTAINLVSALAHAGYRGLLVDMDPQGNATVGCGIAVRETEASIYEVLLGEADVADTVVSTQGGFRLLPSHPDLAGAQVELNSLDRKEGRLGAVLAKIAHEYDNVLIDCPPVLNILTVNALVAAREVLIPVQCEYLALEGLASLMKTISLVQEGLNPELEITGLVRTMFDGRNTLANEVSEQLREHFPDKLFRTVVPRNIRLAEAPGHGKPVLEYDRRCAGSQAYLALMSELLRRKAK